MSVVPATASAYRCKQPKCGCIWSFSEKGSYISDGKKQCFGSEMTATMVGTLVNAGHMEVAE